MSETSKLKHKFMQTMPLVMASSLVFGLNLNSAEPANAETPESPKPPQFKGASKAVVIPVQRELTPHDTAAVTVAQTELRYIVKKGDTVSSIARKHGLSTANVLALNGLGWSSLIFPGQTLTLSKGSAPAATPAPVQPAPAQSAPVQSAATTHTVQSGDTISRIAKLYGVSTQSVLNLNGLGWNSIIYPRQQIKIPGASTPVLAPESSTPAPKPATPEQPAPAQSVPEPSTPESPAPATNTENTAPAAQPAPASCTAVTYTILPGDTVTKIAGKFGVSVQTVLNANGLGWNTIIFAGQKLTIPGVTLVSDDCQVHAELTTEMLINAKIIVEVGRAAGVPEQGLVIALATAAQESGLRNINYGDRDSVGLFQQRPSTGWGTVEQIMDPHRSAKAFFGGSVNPNPGLTRGLLDIPGWQNMTLTQAAQAVQISAFPNAYAKWEASARHWLDQIK